MKDYILFLDETKPEKFHKDFCIGGIVMEREYYEKDFIFKMNELKNKYFNDTSIIFHLSNMRKNTNEFSVLTDPDLRKNFWNEYREILSKSNFEIISVLFNEEKLNIAQQKNKIRVKNRNYEIGLCSLLDLYMHFLIENDGYGHLCIESRTFNENKSLLSMFFNYTNNGSLYFCVDQIEKHIASLGFNIKGDNCIGLQIADIIPSTMLKYACSVKNDSLSLIKILKPKIYKYNSDYEKILGVNRIM